MMVETGLILLRIGTNGGLCEGGNEPPGSLKATKISLNQLNFWVNFDLDLGLTTTCQVKFTVQRVGFVQERDRSATNTVHKTSILRMPAGDARSAWLRDECSCLDTQLALARERPNRPGGCWPHAHNQRWTIIQPEWSVLASLPKEQNREAKNKRGCRERRPRVTPSFRGYTALGVRIRSGSDSRKAKPPRTKKGTSQFEASCLQLSGGDPGGCSLPYVTVFNMGMDNLLYEMIRVLCCCLVNCPKTGWNLISGIIHGLMRQHSQEIMG
ncbi:hypothetical protein ANN_01393 [Periplaneta americana]|uniref:Uncharacterized protein n=1 Tax=Periplaneta americana TaxID=6978 RepID=A0ABQ8TVW0_PERAM|nr:hypothetical protein ANN_01393 [Periplaneta americana]